MLQLYGWFSLDSMAKMEPQSDELLQRLYRLEAVKAECIVHVEAGVRNS